MKRTYVDRLAEFYERQEELTSRQGFMKRFYPKNNLIKTITKKRGAK